MKNLFLMLFILAFTSPGFTQSFGEIQGKVFDEKGDALPYVNVSVNTGTSIVSAQSDFDGRFKVKPLSEGTYTLEVSCINYNDVTVLDIKIKGDQITRIDDIDLTIKVTELGTAVIYSSKIKLINFEETSMKAINMDDFIKSPSAKSVTGIITAVTADIKTNSDGEIMFRGSRPGAGVFYIDGVKIKGTTIPSLPSSAISSVMVYTGGIPAKYGDTTGGVVVIETKSSLTEYYKRKALLEVSK